MSIGKYYYGARFVTNGGDDTEYVMGDGTLSDGSGINTTIGTDTDLTTSGATVVDDIVLTDGVVISHSTRTLTLAQLGYTGDANANEYVLPFTDNSANWNTAYDWGDHDGLYLPLGGGTITGNLQVNGQITQAGVVDKVSWGRTYVNVSVTNIATLVTNDGSALPNGGAYRMTGHIAGTGTDQVAVAVFWNENGTWHCNNTFTGATSTNHTHFLISDGVPKIKTWHASNYNIEVFHERLSLDEGSGTDNLRGYFGADSFLQWTESNNSLVVPGTLAVTGGSSTNWNTAFGWGDHSLAGYTGDQDLSGYLLNTTDTFTGALTVDGDIRGTGQQLILNAGEAYAYATGQSGEYVYVNSEQGLEVNSDTNNWQGNGWADRKTALLRGDLLSLDGESITKTNIQNFKAAYLWGDHSVEGYITSADITASNGLLETAGDIELGGSLSKATLIETGANVLAIYNSSSGGLITASDSATHASGFGSAVFGFGDSSGFLEEGFNAFSDKFEFVSDSGKGIEYDADYSATYTSRSLVDKAYVDGEISSASYVLPTNLAGDDIDIDTTALTGATVISDLDINITTDTSGRVTDANGTVSTRTLTLGDLGFTGDTDANNTAARTDEEIRDVAAAQWIDGTNTTVVVDDAANTIKINATGGSSGIDGSGTASKLPKFSDTDTLTDSNIFENGSGDILINSTTLGDGALNVYQTTTDPSIHIMTDDAGASAGPIIKMSRDSSSPADDDLLGRIIFEGKNSSAGDQVYGQIQGYINDTTVGATLRGGFQLQSMQETTLYTNLETVGTRGYLQNSWYVEDDIYITSGANINIETGATIQLNSSSGTAGQVLTSQGTSSPTWIDTVHSNTTEGGTGSVNIGNMVKITQSAYTALGTPDADTIYIIVG